jgi:hypothetical protein
MSFQRSYRTSPERAINDAQSGYLPVDICAIYDEPRRSIYTTEFVGSLRKKFTWS